MEKRGNLFAEIEEEFKLASEEEINEIMHNSWTEICSELGRSGVDIGTMAMFLAYGAMIGVSSKNGKLNKKEKDLIDDSFGKAAYNDAKIFYEIISKKVDDNDYENLKKVIEIIPRAGISYLKFILSFAYIDGKVDDEDTKKLESTFAMVLMANFFLNGNEKVRKDSKKITSKNKSTKKSTNTKTISKSTKKQSSDGLTQKIVEFFEKDDPFVTLEDIKRHFPKETKETMQKELDKLCNNGYLYKVNTIAGNMYGKT